MFDMISGLFHDIGTLIQVCAQLLIGFVMIVWVGLPLGIGGRPEAAVPLLLGSAALFNAGRTVFTVYRQRIAKF